MGWAQKIRAVLARYRWLLAFALMIAGVWAIGMAWTKMILDFVAALKWPLVLAAVVIAFRDEIRTSLPFLEDLELPGGGKLRFARRQEEQNRRLEVETARLVEGSAELRAASEIRAEAVVERSVPTAAVISTEPPTRPDFSKIERGILDLIATSPTRALAELRFQVLQTIRSGAAGLGLPASVLPSLDAAGRALKAHPYPLLQGWGDIVLTFDDLGFQTLTLPAFSDDDRVKFVAGNIALPALIDEAISLARAPVPSPPPVPPPGASRPQASSGSEVNAPVPDG